MKPTLQDLRDLARAYPEAYEEAPWGELAAKVNGKVFAFYGMHQGALSASLKLPFSAAYALGFDGVKPTGYGLGKHGWITARFTGSFTLDDLRAWLEESYRAVAPKRLSKSLIEGGPEPLPLPPIPEVTGPAKTVLVVTEDALRGDRSIRGLATAGLRGVLSKASTSELAEFDADAIVVDVGRSAAIALEVAGELALIHFDVPLIIAGIKDNKTMKKVAMVAGDAQLFRKPPGDLIYSGSFFAFAATSLWP